MRRLAILVVTAVSVAGVWLWPAGAGALSPVATGWWSKAQAVPVPGVTLPAPPTVPNEGLFVATDPSGPTAISAVRYPVEPNQTGGTLRLTIAEGSSPAGVAVAACPVTEVWDQVFNGPWETRPEFDCTVSVAGQPVEGGLQWELSSAFMAFHPRFVDVALVPSTLTPFQVAFEKPADSSFTPSVTVAPAESTAPAAGPAAQPAPESPAAAPTRAPAPRSRPAATASSTPAEVVAAAPQQEPQPERASGGARTQTEPVIPASDQSERVWATVALALMGLAAFALSGRMPQLAWFRSKGALGDAPPEPAVRQGGIGRFARPRQAPPTRLV